MPHMVSFNVKEKYFYKNPAIIIVSTRMQHKLFCAVFDTREWNIEGWQLAG